MTPRQRLAAVVAVAGSALVAAGSFLPWLQADVEGLGTRNGNGWTNVFGEVGWGPLLVLLAVVVSVGVAPTIVRVPSLGAARVAVGAAVLNTLAVAFQYTRVIVDRPATDVSTQFGLYVLVGGAVLAVIAAVVTTLPGQPAKVSAPRAVGAVG